MSDSIFKFNPEMGNILDAVFGGAPSTEGATASIKFMITRQDEDDLMALGYTPEQISAMTPQQAREILLGAGP